ncbi:uncharacterized protein LOC110920085 [Helianthus annuus]|uniref:uncharacterized protein LOC110920085 n=1 Tax=Helianthus annuus TaxID=4232 RepID=UPI000B8FDC87|nr:uncharacterized protein LOC110920085 [Helianthus annuus]
MSAPNPFMDLAKLKELMSDDIEIIAQQFLELDSDEAIGSSRQKVKRKYIERSREDGDNRMWNDYFAPNPVFPEHFFRRRFRMSIRLFNRIVERLREHNKWFSQRFDAIGRKGFSPQQKRTAAIRQLAYGVAADEIDEIGGF